MLHFQNSSNFTKTYEFKKRCYLKKFRLLIIANASLWHGFDRILFGMQKHDSTDIEIDIFGNGNQTSMLRALALNLNIGDVVKFHDPQNLSFFEKNRRNWNMGVSSLDYTGLNVKNSKPIKATRLCSFRPLVPFALWRTKRWLKINSI